MPIDSSRQTKTPVHPKEGWRTTTGTGFSLWISFHCRQVYHEISDPSNEWGFVYLRGFFIRVPSRSFADYLLFTFLRAFCYSCPFASISGFFYSRSFAFIRGFCYSRSFAFIRRFCYSCSFASIRGFCYSRSFAFLRGFFYSRSFADIILKNTSTTRGSNCFPAC